MKNLIKIENNHCEIIDSTTNPCTSFIHSNLRYWFEGATYARAYEEGEWDGYISLFKFGRFPTGLLHHVVSLLTENNYEFELEDNREKLIDVNPDGLNLHVGSNELYTHQHSMLLKSFNYLEFNKNPWHRGVINAATNSGKTYWAASLLNNLKNCKCLFIVHRKELFNQTYEFFTEVFGEEKVGRIQGKTFEQSKLVDIAMINTLTKYNKANNIEWINDYNTLIMDECHLASANTWYEIGLISNASVRYLISATPWGSENELKQRKIEAIAGNELIHITKDDLIKNDISRKPQIHLHELTHPKENYKSYLEEKDFGIVHNHERNEIIKNIVYNNKDKSIIITVKKLEHMNAIYSYIKSIIKHSKIGLLYGNAIDREDVLQGFLSGSVNVLITTQLIREGINIPIADVMIIAQGGKSKIAVNQLTGRVERKKDNSKTVEVHDFIDKGKHIEKHSKKRIEVYQSPENGYEIVEG